MDRVVRAVVLRVVQAHVSERHVADSQVEVPGGQARVGERLGPHGRVRIQRARQSRARAVQLDAGQLGVGGRQSEEHAGAAARLEHPAAVEPELADGLPDRGDDRRVGVVRVDRRATGAGVPILAEQLAQLSADRRPLAAVLVEHRGDRTPARPSRKRPLLAGARLAGLRFQAAHEPQRSQVRLDAGALTARGELLARDRGERYASVSSRIRRRSS